jgi:penicillin-binding protein 1A
VIADEPVSISAEETGSQAWEPKNYDGQVRRSDEPAYRTGEIQEHGVDPPAAFHRHPVRAGLRDALRLRCRQEPSLPDPGPWRRRRDPWQQLAAYSIFANGGYRITPHIVRQIVDDKGTVLAAMQPSLAGDEALRAIDARNAWLMDSMMHDVVRRGTATRAAAVLKRGDLAGKTGTTNDYIDAWFCGYQPTVVGRRLDRLRSARRMGNGETGGAAALPIWIGFMEHALKGVPESWQETPEGLVTIVAHDPSGKTTRELIYKEHLPLRRWMRRPKNRKQEPTQEPPRRWQTPNPSRWKNRPAQKSAEKKN